MKPTLVLLAAGIGSRYGGLKQLDPVGPGGETILEYSVYDALRAGFEDIVIVVREETEDQFREHLSAKLDGRCRVTYVHQRPDDLPAGLTPPPERTKPLGTAHAAWSCRDVVTRPFAVVNADDFYGRTTFQVIADFFAQRDPDTNEWCMVGWQMEKTLTEHGHVSRGVCRLDDNGHLVGIDERLKVARIDAGIAYTENEEQWHLIPPGSVISMNVWGFTPRLWGHLEQRLVRFLTTDERDILRDEFLLPEVVGSLITDGLATVTVIPTQERWFGITYIQDKPWVKRSLARLVRQGAYPERLWDV